MQDRPAAANALRLSIEHFLRGEPAVAGGWLMRAQRHLREQPECVEHGFLWLIEGTVARFGGDLERSTTLVRRATAIGQRFGHQDLTAMAVHSEGLALIAAGRIDEGLALLDEAMTSVIAGELSSFFTGAVYCNVIAACLGLADVRRADEWSDAAKRWCESLPEGSPYPAICRINRAEVATLRGEWTEAEAEATKASEELMVFDPGAAASAHYLIGEIRRRFGDLDGANAAFERAHGLGFEPQPGLALLRLAHGRTDAAIDALRMAVASEGGDPLRRARLLAAQVDVLVSAGDLDAAQAAGNDLEEISHAIPASVLAAAADTALGAVALARGDVETALERLRRACVTCQELRLPYEAARARFSSGAPSERPATRTAPGSSCAPPSRRSNAWARAPMRSERPPSSARRPPSREGSRDGKPRSCAS